MERLQWHETFDPEKLSDLEIQSTAYELQGNNKAKFDCQVKLTQLYFGINEVSAYHAMVAKRKVEDNELTDDERRRARVDFFQTINDSSRLDFDPYEAALAEEKLDIAKAEGDENKIISSLSTVFSIIFKRPADIFQDPSKKLVDFINELYKQLSFAVISSPSIILGFENSARAEIEKNMDFNKLQKLSRRRWKSLKQAIEN